MTYNFEMKTVWDDTRGNEIFYAKKTEYNFA